MDNKKRKTCVDEFTKNNNLIILLLNNIEIYQNQLYFLQVELNEFQHNYNQEIKKINNKIEVLKNYITNNKIERSYIIEKIEEYDYKLNGLSVDYQILFKNIEEMNNEYKKLELLKNQTQNGLINSKEECENIIKDNQNLLNNLYNKRLFYKDIMAKIDNQINSIKEKSEHKKNEENQMKEKISEQTKINSSFEQRIKELEIYLDETVIESEYYYDIILKSKSPFSIFGSIVAPNQKISTNEILLIKSQYSKLKILVDPKHNTNIKDNEAINKLNILYQQIINKYKYFQ